MSNFLFTTVWFWVLLVCSSYSRSSAYVFGGMHRADGNFGENNRGVLPEESDGSGLLECLWYNDDCFKDTDTDCKRNPEKKTCRCNYQRDYCERPEEGKRAHCYASWSNDTGTPKIVKAGCWLNDQACYDKNECIATKAQPQPIHFCCCEGTMCNSEYSVIFEAPTDPPPFVDATPLPTSPPHATIGYALIIPTVGLVFIAIAYAVYRRQKSLDSRHHQVPTAGDERDDDDDTDGTPRLDRLRPIQLLEIKVRNWNWNHTRF